MAGLEDVSAKLERAKQHYESFVSEVEAWTGIPPAFVSVERQPDPEYWVLRWRVTHPPPVELSLIFGDMLNNLRGALDYLVSQLVLAAGNQPTDRTAFPVVKQAANWASASGDRLKGVRRRWVDAIDSLQPYHDSRPELHPLAVLDHTNNISKHRALPPTILSIGEGTMQVDPKYADSGERLVQLEIDHSPIHDNSIFLTARISPATEA